jgi:hypothetical protein
MKSKLFTKNIMKKILKSNNGKIVFVVGIVLTFIAPFVLTRPACFEWLALADNSFANIGEVIGGITAPIVGLVGAWLIFLTLQEQKNANRDNILLISLQQLDNLIITSGLLEYDPIIETTLIPNFKEFEDRSEFGNVNTDIFVNDFANKQFISFMNVAIQIRIICNGINDSSNEIIKHRIAGIIFILKETHSYKSILQSGIVLMVDGEFKSPIRIIEKVEMNLVSWKTKLPKS